jgi:predicted nucleic acid-binding protein
VIVLDASVLIAHLDGHDAHHQPAAELLRAHAMELIGASQISLAETLVAPARAGRLEDAQEALEKLSFESSPSGTTLLHVSPACGLRPGSNCPTVASC